MAFEQIKERENRIFHERIGILLYHFTASEIKQLRGAARIVGITEVILITPEEGNQTIRQILDNQPGPPCEDAPRQKAVIFNGISGNKVSVFLDLMKKFRFARPLIAMVTEQSIDWPLKEVIANLIDERMSLSQNKISTHI